MSPAASYQRPNQAWVCGRAREGGSCPLGPDARGRCSATAECLPQKQGARWLCTRPEEAGGPCAAGPLPDGRCSRPIEPCTPQRSWLARRAHATFWTVAACVGVIALSLGDERRERFLVPGDLSAHHAKIVSRKETRHCATCHTAAEGGLDRWWACAWGGVTPQTEGRKCLECHERDLGPHPFRPHDLDPALLAPRVATSSRLPLAPAAPGAAGDEMACATCHREHHGRDHDLKAMTDAQCQACHARRFASFRDGHPEFRTYGHVRSTAISFDHATHAERHFGERSAPFECARCHVASRERRDVGVRPFDEACGACHAKEFVGSRENPAPATVVFRLPIIDLEALDGAHAAIGAWPDLTEDDVDPDEPLPPIERLLLRGDEAATRALGKVGNAGLADLGGEEPKAFAAHDVAWGVKTLFADLCERGGVAIEARLEAALGVPGLSGGARPTVFQQAQKAWVPRLAEELARHGESRDPKTEALGIEAPVVEGQRSDGTFAAGWFRTDAKRTIRYQVAGHGDPFYRALLDAAAARPGDADAQAVFADLSRVCLKCHSVRDGGIAWSAERPGRGSVAFSHAPHLKTLDGCATCHRPRGMTVEETALMKEPDMAKRLAGIAAVQDRGDCGLDWMTRATCASCHAPKGAEDHCLECHRYHLTQQPW